MTGSAIWAGFSEHGLCLLHTVAVESAQAGARGSARTWSLSHGWQAGAGCWLAAPPGPHGLEVLVLPHVSCAGLPRSMAAEFREQGGRALYFHDLVSVHHSHTQAQIQRKGSAHPLHDGAPSSHGRKGIWKRLFLSPLENTVGGTR